MPDPLVDIFRSQFRPLEPLPTGETAVLSDLEGIRAVLFDLYGTLFISASGEVGTTKEAACEAALAGALRAVGIEPTGPLDRGVDCCIRAIEAAHAEGRRAGIDYPEIDIVEMWPEILGEMANCGLLGPCCVSALDPRRFAMEYEARANPCWPMPHLQECLEGLRGKGLLLGIISNAQFYTSLLFEALLGEPAQHWGFDRDLQFYSYQRDRAKPGTELYEMAVAALDNRAVRPHNVVYVGNDMLNDIWPASRVGLRTALFAGDARSLRWRGNVPEIEGLRPDLVLTGLMQLVQCINV